MHQITKRTSNFLWDWQHPYTQTPIQYGRGTLQFLGDTPFLVAFACTPYSDYAPVSSACVRGETKLSISIA